jgi:hypothetical protein
LPVVFWDMFFGNWQMVGRSLAAGNMTWTSFFAMESLPKERKEVQGMAHCSTVFSQVVRHLPRARFEKFVREGNGDHRVRIFSCWNLSLSHIFAQLRGVDSLRDLETIFRSRLRNLYHLGLVSCLLSWCHNSAWRSF